MNRSNYERKLEIAESWMEDMVDRCDCSLVSKKDAKENYPDMGVDFECSELWLIPYSSDPVAISDAEDLVQYIDDDECIYDEDLEECITEE
ncbi:hypothetical protein [Stutzerimonas kunmingensis]|uniref:Uncharacterized protein n=1 Tax=Stutzerimonas kunmingensis TaxID=1211807 RepID=A0A9X1N450_9GAMM|nr:hypothetical protein [Stutzerimonas kunmingensis]MCD1608616.1 hypothetical protein [Stutzerimonas kunmingensis]